jgi:hypothetical protein
MVMLPMVSAGSGVMFFIQFTAKEYHECRWLGRGDRFWLGFWILGDREEKVGKRIGQKYYHFLL